ncbi:MAG: hypothetical protein R2744_11660 [Bacteroidales bacterium]
MIDPEQNKENLNQLLHDQKERLKELACINRTTAILKEGKSTEETLQKVLMSIPQGWQYPDYTRARITCSLVYTTPDFNETGGCSRRTSGQ